MHAHMAGLAKRHKIRIFVIGLAFVAMVNLQAKTGMALLAQMTVALKNAFSQTDFISGFLESLASFFHRRLAGSGKAATPTGSFRSDLFSSPFPVALVIAKSVRLYVRGRLVNLHSTLIACKIGCSHVTPFKSHWSGLRSTCNAVAARSYFLISLVPRQA